MTREQTEAHMAQIVLSGMREQAARTPREAAEAAWYPGHRLGTVEAIEAQEIQRRTEDAALLAAQTPNAA